MTEIPRRFRNLTNMSTDELLAKIEEKHFGRFMLEIYNKFIENNTTMYYIRIANIKLKVTEQFVSQLLRNKYLHCVQIQEFNNILANIRGKCFRIYYKFIKDCIYQIHLSNYIIVVSNFNKKEPDFELIEFLVNYTFLNKKCITYQTYYDTFPKVTIEELLYIKSHIRSIDCDFLLDVDIFANYNGNLKDNFKSNDPKITYKTIFE